MFINVIGEAISIFLQINNMTMKKSYIMLKGFLFSIALLCLSAKSMAQCATSQYLIDLNAEIDAGDNPNNTNLVLSLSKDITTFNRVDFNIKSNAFPLTIDFGNGVIKSFSSNTIETQLYPSTTTMNSQITVISTPSGATSSINFTIRILTTPYQKPDAVWDITNSYTPTCAGCTPDINGGLAKAYIKYANPDKKLRKILVFVEGIDFSKKIIYKVA
jgi:hypothetical protein